MFSQVSPSCEFNIAQTHPQIRAKTFRNTFPKYIMSLRSKDCKPQTAQIRISLRSFPTLAAITALDSHLGDFYSQLCYHHEPTDRWLQLPQDMQAAIDDRRCCGEIARLQVKGLIDVEVCS